MSWKAEVLVDGKWYDNAIRLATEEEARVYGLDLFRRWFVPADWRVVTSDDPANYRCHPDGRLEALEPDERPAHREGHAL